MEQKLDRETGRPVSAIVAAEAVLNAVFRGPPEQPDQPEVDFEVDGSNAGGPSVMPRTGAERFSARRQSTRGSIVLEAAFVGVGVAVGEAWGLGDRVVYRLRQLGDQMHGRLSRSSDPSPEE
jgi:hypothetical protein